MILVMLSGGLDSTGVLYHLLTKNSEPLHVHHISIRNKENRWQVEKKAAENVIEYTRKIRPFKITTNMFGFRMFQNFICWDNDIVRFVAAQICQNDPAITQVALGKCKDDDTPDFSERAVQSASIWDACFSNYPRHKPEIIRPMEELTKKEIHERLPEELKNVTWSCRTPILNYDKTKFLPCLLCKTCLQMKKYEL